MKRQLPLAVILLIITACNRPYRKLPDPAAVRGASIEGQLVSSGVSRHYILHVSSAYQPGTPVPLVLNFHGYTSNSKEEEALTGMSSKADQEGFIVAYPDGLDAAWNTGPGTDGRRDLQFVRDLIAALESQYSIDATRIYATGMSNGGGMANRLGCSMADTIAAIAPNSGAYFFWQDCSPARPIPVLAFHGLDDNVVPYTGSNTPTMEPPIPDWAAAWAKRDGCNSVSSVTTLVDTVKVQVWSGCQGDAEVILYTLDHHGHSWPGSAVMPKAITSQAVNATDVIWNFFKAHHLP